MHVVNPITCEQIALPSVITIDQVKPIYDDAGAICKYHYSLHTAQSVTGQRTLDVDQLRYYFHHKAYVFYETSSGRYIVVFIHNPFGQLVFARLGDEKWTRLTSHILFQDCIYKDGLLYAVTSFGQIIAFDRSGSVVTEETILDGEEHHYGSTRFYIVQAPWGNLLQVWKPEIQINEVMCGHGNRTLYQNILKWMRIYKVCTEAKKLVEIESLDAHVLFIGKNLSFCSRAEDYPQLKPNHVYFTDDVECVAFRPEMGIHLSIGILDLGNNCMDEIILPQRSSCLAPLLVIPNPRKMESALHI